MSLLDVTCISSVADLLTALVSWGRDFSDPEKQRLRKIQSLKKEIENALELSETYKLEMSEALMQDDIVLLQNVTVLYNRLQERITQLKSELKLYENIDTNTAFQRISDLNKEALELKNKLSQALVDNIESDINKYTIAYNQKQEEIAFLVSIYQKVGEKK